MLLEVKMFVEGQDKVSKDTFFQIHLIFQINFILKIGDLKYKDVTLGGGGSQKSDKIVSHIT
jgi:hypothetical protein